MIQDYLGGPNIITHVLTRRIQEEPGIERNRIESCKGRKVCKD